MILKKNLKINEKLYNFINQEVLKDIKSKTGSNVPHTLSKATDIFISEEKILSLFVKARQIVFSGIGLSQKGIHASRFDHLDMLTRKALFSYYLKILKHI